MDWNDHSFANDAGNDEFVQIDMADLGGQQQHQPNIGQQNGLSEGNGESSQKKIEVLEKMLLEEKMKNMKLEAIIREERDKKQIEELKLQLEESRQKMQQIEEAAKQQIEQLKIEYQLKLEEAKKRANEMMKIAMNGPPTEIGPLPSQQIMGGLAPRDPEKLKLLQQQLVLLLHAHKCQLREKQQDPQNRMQQCTLPYCCVFKGVLAHMVDCKLGRQCRFAHCYSSSQLSIHWKNCCNKEDCPVCTPVKKYAINKSQDEIGDISQPQSVQPAAAMQKNQPAPSMENLVIFGSPAPPAVSVNDFLDGYDPNINPFNQQPQISGLGPSNDAIHDQRIKDLMFETAPNKEAYYHNLAEKIYKIQKELQEK